MPRTITIGSFSLRDLCGCPDPCPECCNACCDLGEPPPPEIFCTYTSSGCVCGDNGVFSLQITGNQQWTTLAVVTIGTCPNQLLVVLECTAGTSNRYQLSTTLTGQPTVVSYSDSKSCTPFQVDFNNVTVGTQSDSGGDCTLVMSFTFTL